MCLLRGYVKRVKQKAEKLSKEQVLSLLEDVVDENESLYSVFESLYLKVWTYLFWCIIRQII